MSPPPCLVRSCGPLVLVVSAALSAGPAAAQSRDAGIDAHGFNLAAQDGDLRDLLTIQRPGRFDASDWGVGSLIEVARRPLILIVPTGDTSRVEPVVDRLVALNLTGGLAPHERVRLDVVLPLYLDLRGRDGRQGGGLGDLRLSAMVVALRPPAASRGFGLGFVPHIDLPSGNPDTWTGRGRVAGGLRAAATWERDTFTVSGDLGVQLNPRVSERNLTGADTVGLGVGGSWLFERSTALGLELRAAAPLRSTPLPGTETPVELLVHARHRRPNGLGITVGVGSALTRGVGAATPRVFAGVSFGAPPPFTDDDRDGDGIADRDDACPDEAEVFNGYLDQDGCPDELARVTVLVRVDGVERAGVPLTLSGPGGATRTLLSKADGREIELIPGAYTFVSDDPKLAPWTGTLSFEEGDNTAVLDLQPLASGSLAVRVTDPKGVPTAATITLSGEGAPEPTDLVGGEGRLELPPGEYRALVQSPGFADHTETVRIEPGAAGTLQVMLRPSRVKVGATKIEIEERVHFEVDGAVIKPASYPLLDRVAEVIVRDTRGKIEVQGHTDSDGSASYNLGLSERRATAVRTYLIGKGVPADRLVAHGYGEAQPIDSNDTAEGKARNRRVEFVLLDKEGG